MNNKQDDPSVRAALSATERRESERSKDDRRGVADKVGDKAGPRPDPEATPRAKRRSFTAEYKRSILDKADAAKGETGAVTALLRREGLYSSHLVNWRKERSTAILQGLAPNKRGPKSKANPLDEEVKILRRQNLSLAEELRKTLIVIDVQKKVAALLGLPLPAQDREEKS
jgi:transposase